LGEGVFISDELPAGTSASPRWEREYSSQTSYSLELPPRPWRPWGERENSAHTNQPFDFRLALDGRGREEQAG
jgi:hypothetical protein